ncbi:MAG: UDP-2,3-diacylglucosamine diphosphatase [Azoarcus sp.]|jgi:UDP-2,3-diacylglucosamine hydrolase|nr:UDP-2,3-diacylglucosamine diphosphatase [Azoarcus sp.]
MASCAGPASALPAFFIADLHLAAGSPETAAAFDAFLHGPARAAGHLYILGDLFESWAGDDDAADPFNQQICAWLRELSAVTTIFFVPGNRDVLVGTEFARRAGLTLLPDQALLSLGGLRILVTHGDEFCTDDLAYQDFRQQVHSPDWQAMFLAQPLATRKQLIARLRAQSEAAKREKPLEIMDVNADAIARCLRAHAYPILIHGHTHRPARHSHLVDGHVCARHVLADWRDHPTWLAFDGAAFTEYACLE